LDTGRRLVCFDYLARRRAHSYASSAGKHIQPKALENIFNHMFWASRTSNNAKQSMPNSRTENHLQNQNENNANYCKDMSIGIVLKRKKS